MRQEGFWTPENTNLSQEDHEEIVKRRMNNPNRSGWDRPDDNPSTTEIEDYFRNKPRKNRRDLCD